ncbi:MAG: aminotransferase class V-fold PLP-dependent enzyme, partial [Verrucomicrobiota bacterium]
MIPICFDYLRLLPELFGDLPRSNPFSSPVLYFDHNASSPLSSPAREAWLDATSRFIGNPSSPHRLGSRADAALATAREKLASWLGADSLDIVWTSGATESNNTVIHHLAGELEGEAWISAIEHPCVMESVRRWFAGRHRLIPVNGNGQVELDWLQAAFRHSKPAFVGVMAANNETGVLQPWNAIAKLCQEEGVAFFC